MKSFIEFLKEVAGDADKYGELVKDWNKLMEDAGYFSVYVDRYRNESTMQEMIQWCMKKFTYEHFKWTGSRFWFEKQEDAVLFALKWL